MIQTRTVVDTRHGVDDPRRPVQMKPFGRPTRTRGSQKVTKRDNPESPGGFRLTSKRLIAGQMATSSLPALRKRH